MNKQNEQKKCTKCEAKIAVLLGVSSKKDAVLSSILLIDRELGADCLETRLTVTSDLSAGGGRVKLGEKYRLLG